MGKLKFLSKLQQSFSASGKFVMIITINIITIIIIYYDINLSLSLYQLLEDLTSITYAFIALLIKYVLTRQFAKQNLILKLIIHV